MFTDIRIEKYELGRILSSGWKIYLEKFKDIALVILVVYIPINIITSFIPLDTEGFEGVMLYLKVFQLLELFIGVIATIAITKIVEGAVNGEQIGYINALKFSLTRWGRGIAVQIIAGLIIFGFLLLLIVPGIIWAVYYSFVIFVVALRGVNGKTALDYSKRLVKGQWGRVFEIGLVLNILTILTAFTVAFVMGIFITEIKVFGVISDTIVDLVTAMFMVMWVVFFLNVDYLKPVINEAIEQ